jgi:hypothetical protein
MASVGFVVDENDDPVTFRVQGYDPANLDMVYTCRLEMWPGGRAVFRAFDPRPLTIAADPISPPDEEEVQESRQARAADARKREAEARAEELARRKDEQRRAEEKAAIDEKAREADAAAAVAAKKREPKAAAA